LDLNTSFHTRLAHNREQERVREVDDHRRTARRQANEDTRDERIEQNRMEKKPAPHLFLAATIFTAPIINEQHSCEQGQATTSVDTAAGTVSTTAMLPEWLAGPYMMIMLILVIIWAVMYWVGAAKLSYDTSGSALWALLAFLFAPFYYPYYAFFVSKPAPAPMMGGARDPIIGLYKAAKDVYKTFKPKH
jgi:hypothetical protein